jgi:hypothetical protein
MDIANALSNTALGITSALATPPPMSFVYAGIVAAMGALQLGVITKNKPKKQSYDKGGPTKGLGFRDDSGFEVAGVVHEGEYVVPKWLRKDPEVARMERYIEYKRTSGQGSFADGGQAQPPASPRSAEPSADNLRLLAVLERTNDILDRLEQTGILAYIADKPETYDKIQKGIDTNRKVRDNAKVIK